MGLKDNVGIRIACQGLGQINLDQGLSLISVQPKEVRSRL